MASPSLRHQQRLQSQQLNRALHQQLVGIKMMNAFQRQRQQQHLKSTQHYSSNIHLMGVPKAPPQPSSPNAFFPPHPFVQFPPFQGTPRFFPPFPPFHGTPRPRHFAPFKFQRSQQQQKKQIPKIIGQIGKAFATLPLKLLKLMKPGGGGLLGGGGGHGGHGGFRGTIRNRRQIGPFRGRGLFGIGLLSRKRRTLSVRIPTTHYRVPPGRGKGKGRGRPKGSRDKRKRVTRRKAETMRQRLERQRWGKAGMRAARARRKLSGREQLIARHPSLADTPFEATQIARKAKAAGFDPKS